jgi:NitT/TauT family transport system permease protein/sulfonate transport system permease protein
MPSDQTKAGEGTGFRLLDHVLADGFVVAVVIAWWLYAQKVPDYIFPSPATVGTSLLGLFTEPAMLMHTLASLSRVIAAVMIAALVGGGLALLAHYRPVTRDIVHARIKPFLLAFPSIGWALLAIVWFNISISAVIFVQVAVLIPFSLVNIGEGLRELDRELLEMTTSFSRSRRRAFTKVIWPLLYPYVIAGMRMSYGVGLKIALIAEVFGSKSGLGFLMHDAQETADTPLVFATCLALVILFAAGDRLVFGPLSRLYRGKAASAPAAANA